VEIQTPIISRFFGIIIRMFFNEHSPPHFHAKYAGQRAIIDIQTLKLMEGNLPRRALELVMDWAELHQEELMKDWDLCQSHQDPVEIAPLE
jgi:hypothetical protein